MGDHIAIRYHVKIKREHMQGVSYANYRKDGSDILSWNRANLMFADPVAYKVWQEFLEHPISRVWPDSDLMHFNPQGWPIIARYFSWLTGIMKGTQCMKVIPGGVETIVKVLPLIADEWKLQVDIRDTLFDPFSGSQEFVDVYTHTGNDLYADRSKKFRDEECSGCYGFQSNN